MDMGGRYHRTQPLGLTQRFLNSYSAMMAHNVAILSTLEAVLGLLPAFKAKQNLMMLRDSVLMRRLAGTNIGARNMTLQVEW